MRISLSIAVSILIQAAASIEYDPALGRSLVYYSAGAFCEQSSLETWTCGPACQTQPGVISTTFVSDNNAGTFGYVAYNALTESIIVAFRGSRNLENWYENLDYFKEPYPNGPAGSEVHTGFYNAYLTLSS